MVCSPQIVFDVSARSLGEDMDRVHAFVNFLMAFLMPGSVLCMHEKFDLGFSPKTTMAIRRRGI
jgi:hypothetical protein